jgi:hypothetical protein
VCAGATGTAAHGPWPASASRAGGIPDPQSAEGRELQQILHVIDVAKICCASVGNLHEYTRKASFGSLRCVKALRKAH